MDIARLSNLVPIIPDFPKAGVNFRNIAPLFRDVAARTQVIDILTQHCLTIPIDVVVGIEARGFLFGVLLAQSLKVPFVMARKPSKLPGKTEKIVYNLEYATNSLELESDSIQEKQNILIVDDILATGGSIIAVYDLVRRMGAFVSGICCMATIEGLGGIEKIKKHTGLDSYSLWEFHSKPQETKVALQEEHKIEPNPALITLLYHPTMSSLAERIHKVYPDIFELGHITWQTFPDGFANVRFPGNLAGKRVVFLASLYDKLSYMDQLSVMMVLPRQLIQSLDIMLPYYAPGTMERIESPGILATADTYAQITSRAFPLTREGPPVLTVYDLHNSTTRFSFSNDVCFQPLSAVPQVLEEISDMCFGVSRDPNRRDQEYWTVVFPDEGSYKRFRGLIPDHHNMVVCGKIRDGDKRTVTIMETRPIRMNLQTIEHAVIVDDLVQTGGTIFECYQALKKAGAKRVSAYCTHAVFPRREYLHFFPGGKWQGLENFWITDSIPKNSDLLQGHPPFRVISLAPSMIRNIFDRLSGEHPVPALSIALTSKNTDKKRAVWSAFRAVFPLNDIDIVAYDCPSKIAQPIGVGQTMDCASSRFDSVPNHTHDYVVSIENGIRSLENRQDFALVMIENRDKSQRIADITGDHTLVDVEIMEEYRKRCDAEPNLTCGDIYQQHHGYDKSNWHVHVGGKSRIYLMKQSVIHVVQSFRNC